MTARETAFKALCKTEGDEAYCGAALRELLRSGALSPVDRALATELVYGVTRRRLTLDYIADFYAKKGRFSTAIRNILRLGLYQIAYMDKIPLSAACDEAVKLARRYSNQAAAGLVNGIMRAASRAAEAARPRVSTDFAELRQGLSSFGITCPAELKAALEYSFPPWMAEALARQYGNIAGEIMESLNVPLPADLRVNVLKNSREQLLASLKNEGIAAAKHPTLPHCVTLASGTAIDKTASYAAGLFTPQNRSSQIVAPMTGARTGDFVIDMCAAPGGKTTHLAELMKNDGKILAFDLHPHKLELINKTAERLDLSIIEAQARDSAEPDSALAQRADIVLLDAPCSGLGTIPSKPDIKWRRQAGDIASLARLQKKLMDAASLYVKPGGTLVYSTCTILSQENEDQIRGFLAEHRDFVSIEERCLLPRETRGSGFYIHKLRRKEK